MILVLDRPFGTEKKPSIKVKHVKEVLDRKDNKIVKNVNTFLSINRTPS
jgi:hypothetical protein